MVAYLILCFQWCMDMMNISTKYMGPKVIFVDGKKDNKVPQQLVADFKGVGICAQIESQNPPLAHCDLIISVIDKHDMQSADILISTIPLKKKGLLYRAGNRSQQEIDFVTIQKALDEWQQQQPLWACILIGGKSSRMGRPKHLLTGPSHRTWLEEKIALLSPLVKGIVLSGTGEVPGNLSHYERLQDAGGLVGPMAGVLGVMQAYPQRSWLVCACDMPLLSCEAVQWLCLQRRFAKKAIIPMRDGIKKGRAGVFAEPLFACYESSCRENIETLADAGVLRMSRMAEDESVVCPVIPQELQNCWANINTPDDVRKMKS